ncbi:MAG: helix-turn-helix transcriptional regulator [Bacteroidota bacterium]|nr:helix-turn-helix transcriptional regulator [Bacteroidota bacterium]
MQKDEFLVALGVHLRKIRESHNLTQADLANLIGKDRQSYQRIEAGTTNPTIWYLQNIAEALNISLKELLNFN